MSVGKISTKDVATAIPDETLRQAARRMAARNVGTLVILDSLGRPSGLVSDRDLMLQVLVEERNPDTTTVSEVMSTPVAAVHENADVDDALREMAACRVRRMPVVDGAGKLVGILALDDVLGFFAKEAADVALLLGKRV
jgi:CBS domain-containing protein